MPSGLTTCACRLVIGSKRLEDADEANIRSALTTNGEFASSGKATMRTKSRLSTITDLRNPHPGEILLEEFLKPMELSQTKLAHHIGVPPRRINEIVLGKRAVTADTDLRLARYFGVSEGFFMGLQTDYELLERKRKIGAQLNAIRPKAA
jgi:addiction module HigA family antidote